jgi:hypothetical protein
MTFYVYKATGRLSKNVWELVSELDNYDAARSHVLRIFAPRNSVVAVTKERRVLLNVRYAPIAAKVRSAAK